MNFPNLILNQFCNTIITELEIEQKEMNERGFTENILLENIRCNFQNNNKKVYTKDKRELTSSGTIYINGDIFKDYDDSIVLSYVKINNNKYNVLTVEKGRNLDGTVNFIKLEVE